ncbi:TspO/MBR family protein [Pontixanthobacter sp. CEM42]|uniref:TspO/MBR family protein n=1 Tax=Pontixanthobacter sp. CEM42 TaxID=2792077 RepID=UPI0032AEA19E
MQRILCLHDCAGRIATCPYSAAMETYPLIIAIAWAVILGGAGGLLTEIGPWYRDLDKPSWQPPDWLFGPAWTIILGLAAWAFYLSWTAAGTQQDRLLIGSLYAVNFICHLAWSPLFFKFKRPDWALFEVVFLWLSVLSLCILLRQYSVAASWMIVPYLVWVSFASILNWQIVKLNGPCGRPA